MAARSINSARVWPPELRPETRKQYRELIFCKARGLTEREIAAAMGISVHMVKHLSRALLNHFGAATTIEAVLMARREWNLEL